MSNVLSRVPQPGERYRFRSVALGDSNSSTRLRRPARGSGRPCKGARVLTLEHLQRVWGPAHSGPKGSVLTIMKNLRRKLGVDADHHHLHRHRASRRQPYAEGGDGGTGGYRDRAPGRSRPQYTREKARHGERRQKLDYNSQGSKSTMTRRDRPVADRQKSLEPAPPEANFVLAGVRQLYEGGGGKAFPCTISEYCRTQIFEFPGIDFHPNGEEPHHTIYSSPSVQGCVASNLVDYFVNSTCSKHYAISPSLRHQVGETDERIRSQQRGRVPVFLVIEEFSQLTPVEMFKGECSIWDEIVVRDGKKVPMLIGGREGEQFLTAWATTDGAWPKLPNNQHLVNMILAGVRSGQQTADPIRKYLDRNGLVTDDGRFVGMCRPTVSARASTATPMDTTAYRDRANEISRALAAMEQDISAPHMTLLVNSMYRDDYKDDAYQRLQYLQLWQSLVDAGRKYLGYQGRSIRYDNKVVAGTKTLLELTEYRDDIAHWWTDTINENFLADLQQTTNELIRRKYF